MIRVWSLACNDQLIRSLSECDSDIILKVSHSTLRDELWQRSRARWVRNNIQLKVAGPGQSRSLINANSKLTKSMTFTRISLLGDCRYSWYKTASEMHEAPWKISPTIWRHLLFKDKTHLSVLVVLGVCGGGGRGVRRGGVALRGGVVEVLWGETCNRQHFKTGHTWYFMIFLMGACKYCFCWCYEHFDTW